MKEGELYNTWNLKKWEGELYFELLYKLLQMTMSIIKTNLRNFFIIYLKSFSYINLIYGQNKLINLYLIGFTLN